MPILSTDFPYGVVAVENHITSDLLLSMNVSKEDDAAFMRELKRTDPKRHALLLKNMRLSVKVATRETQPRCKHCGLVLPVDIRTDGQHCDDACKRAAYRLRKAA